MSIFAKLEKNRILKTSHYLYLFLKLKLLPLFLPNPVHIKIQVSSVLESPYLHILNKI